MVMPSFIALMKRNFYKVITLQLLLMVIGKANCAGKGWLA